MKKLIWQGFFFFYAACVITTKFLSTDTQSVIHEATSFIKKIIHNYDGGSLGKTRKTAIMTAKNTPCSFVLFSKHGVQVSPFHPFLKKWELGQERREPDAVACAIPFIHVSNNVSPFIPFKQSRTHTRTFADSTACYRLTAPFTKPPSIYRHTITSLPQN